MTKMMESSPQDRGTATDEDTPRQPSALTGPRRLTGMSRALPLAGLVLLIIVYTIAAGDRFMTFNNWANLVQQASVVAIIGFGLTFVVIAGSIDLSVGSVAAFSGMAAAMTATGHGSFMGVAAGLGVGAVCGLVNGVLCSLFKVPSFIVTLGMLSVARGLTIVVSDSRSEPVSGALAWMGVAPGIYIALGCAFVAAFVLMNGTTFGRYTRSIGGEERVSALSGVPVRLVKVAAFVVSGLLAGLGGVVLGGQLGIATAQAATGFELSAIAAVVLGGTPLTGGIGNVWNTAIGAFIIVVLNNGLVILGVAPEVQQVIQGVILVLAVFVALDRSKIGIIK
ncbi:ABC transporter permease [Streptomyces sp. DSM 41524]|uniref:ABC transporter permease n=1 Tax=Streptomyces asiaticus subsp. ignotus TaxID=3098222 RepID=A0ABU7QF33_9ACTN|nr:ABC transporter permease [Streptomyces sp. DSM 41524]